MKKALGRDANTAHWL